MSENEDYTLKFPDVAGEAQEFKIPEGRTLFVLGANGTGKSALMHKLYSQNRARARRISAHRQTWFTSNAMDFTSSRKVDTETNIFNHDANAQSRWRDDYAAQRSQVVVFDLINAQNIRAREIADNMDQGEYDQARELSLKDAPIKILNQLLKLSNLPIEISIGKDEKVFASKNGSSPYSIAELSDGERNAILIAADVLTSAENTLFIIDEPERHLHRSIISPLLTSLFSQRKDCTFVIATHDIGLPLDNPDADILLVRSCEWNGGNIIGWDTDLITSADEIDYQIKQDILGSRRALLFVEGAANSLDLHIYQILFSSASVIPQGSCVDVEKAVLGIASTDALHWVNAVGLIDADDRPDSKIAELKAQNIFALPCYSVESIYYCPEVIEAVASKSVDVHGGDVAELISEAHKAFFKAIDSHKDRLSARLCERKVRHQIKPPNWQTIQNEKSYNIQVDLEASLKEEKQRFDEYVSDKDVASIISRYPVRETPALDAVANALKFASRQNYEDAVRKLLTDDEVMREKIKAMFGDLVDALDSHNEQGREREQEVALGGVQ